MRKAFYYFLLPVLGCGELGVETDISRTVEVVFEVDKEQVNRSSDFYQLRQTIDFAADDFAEYIDDAQRFTIERLSYELQNMKIFEGRTNDLIINAIIDREEFKLLSAEQMRENTGRVVLYEEGSSNNLLTAEQIQVLEQIASRSLERKSSDVAVIANFSGPLGSDFKMIFYFDIVARVELK